MRVLLGPDGTVEVDYHARLGGRGAWLMPRREVFAAAEARPGILRKALQVETCVVAGLLDRVRVANERAVGNLLSLAARSGALASGGDQVEGAVRAGALIGLLVASDASTKSVEGAVGATGLQTWTVPWDRESLGGRIGKGPRAIVGLRGSSITRVLADQLRRMHDLR